MDDAFSERTTGDLCSMHKGLAKFFDFRGKNIESGRLAIGKFWNVCWLVGIYQWQAWVAVASL